MIFDITTDEALARTGKMLQSWNQDIPLLIKGFHITTSSNCCAELSVKGIEPLADVLNNTNSELNRFLQCYGIAVDAFGGEVIQGGRTFSLSAYPFNQISKLLKRKVSAFLWCSHVDKYGEIHYYPEILNEMVKSNILPKKALAEWKMNRRAYKIYFTVGLNEIAADHVYLHGENARDVLAKQIRDRKHLGTNNCEIVLNRVPAECIESIVPL